MAKTSDKSAGSRKAERKLQHQQAVAAAQAEVAANAARGSNNSGSAGGKAIHEERILEAIDQLRRRKARPDADRICNYLLRKFKVDARDTIADLQRLIEAEKVILVDYKGHASYRNASKWTRLQLYKNRPEGFVKEKINSRMVAGAVAELVVEEPDYLDQGVPAVRLVEQLLDGVKNPTSRRMVEDFLGKEVASGNLARLSNGNYSLVDGSSNNMGNGAVATAAAATQNGEVVTKIKPATTPYKEPSHPYDLNEFEEFAEEHDSSSTTHKSSRHTSPKSELEPMKKEDCYEIIVGKRQGDDDGKAKDSNVKLGNGFRKDDVKDNDKAANAIKEEPKSMSEQQPGRRSKTERKQRLCVRSDDSSDILFNEDYRKETSYKDEHDKRDDCMDRLSDDEECDHDAGRSSTNPSPTPSNNNAGGFRSTRRKRAKKVFDPSDNMVVKRKRGRLSNAHKALLLSAQEAQETAKIVPAKESPNKEPNRQCSLCTKDKQESLIACRDCTVRAHPSCIYTSEEMVHKAHMSWQCERCKTCVICYETSESGPLVTCYSCDDAYHYSCHSPRIPAAKTKWICNECHAKQVKITSMNSNSNWSNGCTEQQNNVSSASVASPPVSPRRNSSEHIDDDRDSAKDIIDPNIPDVTDWSSEQVYQYFARLFPKDAEVFRQQEIDGHSLILLKRNDVLRGFNLLLGPALKIYRNVLKLQLRRDDPNKYWL